MIVTRELIGELKLYLDAEKARFKDWNGKDDRVAAKGKRLIEQLEWLKDELQKHVGKEVEIVEVTQ